MAIVKPAVGLLAGQLPHLAILLLPWALTAVHRVPVWCLSQPVCVAPNDPYTNNLMHDPSEHKHYVTQTSLNRKQQSLRGIERRKIRHISKSCRECGLECISVAVGEA
ncbi:hypothetical protein CALCODRAFT_263567 [Calocera cornea HHB12733]|uniref:Uncharacterized protein n=1 Tax=Calocera cornea HHB12733 TaxID=1353952 RepID=A0A165GCC1_9BASI|nr:hypothetical protein CALCODRAFT_263567 [Calocera cornea HHB12733]